MTDKRNDEIIEERIFKSGGLSKKASYRIIVKGKIGEKEIERLIKNLEMEKELLK